MIYENVKKLADKKGISLKQLEVKAGVGNGIIGKWRESSPTVDSIKAVADALGVKVTDILKGV